MQSTIKGFITVCFSDWTKEKFNRGVMRIVNGDRTDYPVRRDLKPWEKENIDYYVKPDPDFSKLAYRSCHRKLRQKIQPGDILFFRTLWRGSQYFIGYFLIKEKTGDSNNPICIGDRPSSFLSPEFKIKITEEMVRKLNPKAVFKKMQPVNPQINHWLGRNYLKLDTEKTVYLMSLIQKHANQSKYYYKVVTQNLKSVGLLGAKQLQYKIGKWVYPLESFSTHRFKGGGLWVLREKSDAFGAKKYLKKKHEIKARIFSCKTGCILYQTSYRTKTTKVKLINEIT